MKDLKNCFFSISDGSIPYLYDLMEDLDNNGVRNFTMDPAAPVPALEIPGGSYTITDNRTGVEFARQYDTGYVYYTSESCSHKLSVSDAQCVIEGFDEVTADFIEKMYQRKNEIPWIILETPRTIIKEISLSDIDELFELYKDPDIIRFIPPLQPTKREELDFQKEYIKKMYGFFGYGFWNVIDRDSNKLIGRAGLSNREGFEYLELGYLFSKPYRGKGIATEVCAAIIKYAVEILGAERLNAFIQPENTGSVHLAEKLGFKYTGEEIESMGNLLRRYVLDVNKSVSF
ncbi:MAG: GNAT family N-acetyltransferase [Lachnospiraceae bacterium]|nr:GNAT family N-acetyltransferase [Lachnospiraceae bacterium]